MMYSQYKHRQMIACWPEWLRASWGELAARIEADTPGIHPLDAEVEAFENIQAGLVATKKADPHFDWAAKGFRAPAELPPIPRDYWAPCVIADEGITGPLPPPVPGAPARPAAKAKGKRRPAKGQGSLF